MKNYFSITGVLLVGLTLMNSSCDKIEYPNVIITDLDTNLYPGNFIDYDFPDFEPNTNTLRNIIIADYTGHQCTFCPPAATKAKEIEDAHPDRVFVASIHASAEPGGIGTFQETNATFTRDLTNPQGAEMGSTFAQASVGFSGNPSGNVNRVKGDDGKFFLAFGFWADKTDEVLATPLDINIQAKSTYFPSTSGVFLHVETEFLSDLDGDYNIVVYALENEWIGPQKFPTETDLEYKHHNIHRGNLFGETWGRNIASGTTEAGTKFRNDFSYSLPDGLTNTQMHFLVLVYNRSTYEIMQVIEHHF